ncbi:hypothetical protein L873DRAFT_178544 [Choiromyces venosus 120613-1]|uniref:Uncharacterized protein n=1 Tax=Choiromyces venosus 120613-1 TaxID=1336337 RepID=A0A3N4K249_9PEZI|nr:hypothetical protein L873DRAFT_178544 [Choiromyces venosus 120613-1]
MGWDELFYALCFLSLVLYSMISMIVSQMVNFAMILFFFCFVQYRALISGFCNDSSGLDWGCFIILRYVSCCFPLLSSIFTFSRVLHKLVIAEYSRSSL